MKKVKLLLGAFMMVALIGVISNVTADSSRQAERAIIPDSPPPTVAVVNDTP